MLAKSKSYGRVFTPLPVVRTMLDLTGYTQDNPNLLDISILEPSFGEGVFLIEMLDRVLAHAENNNLDKNKVLQSVQQNFHGVELDKELFQKTCASLNQVLESNDYPPLSWDNLINNNTLLMDFPQKYDLVIGNPPYVRVHNLDKETRDLVKRFTLTTGSTDLYIAFFELGINALNETGKLVYITPNSFMKNSSQKKMRQELITKRQVSKVINYRSSKVFSDADTYAAITILTPESQRDSFSYEVWEENAKEQVIVDYSLLSSSPESAWEFDSSGSTVIATQRNRSQRISDIANVGYGIATLRDRIYIDHSPTEHSNGVTVFNGLKIENDILRPIVKASKYQGGTIGSRILFPYYSKDGRYTPYDEAHMRDNYPLAYTYLNSHKEELAKRSMDKGASIWYQFGRSQGMTHIDTKKIVPSSVLVKGAPIVPHFVPVGSLVYSGFYLCPKDDHTIDDVLSALSEEEMAHYIAVVGKDMAGGYVSVRAENIKNFKFK